MITPEKFTLIKDLPVRLINMLLGLILFIPPSSGAGIKSPKPIRRKQNHDCSAFDPVSTCLLEGCAKPENIPPRQPQLTLRFLCGQVPAHFIINQLTVVTYIFLQHPCRPSSHHPRQQSLLRRFLCGIPGLAYCGRRAPAVLPAATWQ